MHEVLWDLLLYAATKDKAQVHNENIFIILANLSMFVNLLIHTSSGSDTLQIPIGLN